MIVSMKEMLADAQKNRYAIPAFDVSNYEMMCAVLDACEEEGAPALLMGLEVDLRGKRMDLMAALVEAASKQYRIPICFHLDHGTNLDIITRAMDAGFRSVMYDGSALPFRENANRTAEAVRLAHAKGITVEAELGHVGNAMVGNEADSVHNEDPEDTLTDPSDVVAFVQQTQVDALAVAIGTAHGVYQKTPTLRIDRLKEISGACSCPLVLHGGSGTPADQLKKAIENGITKINIYSDVVAAMNAGLRGKLNTITNPATWPVYVFEDARNNMKEVVKEKLHVYGCTQRV